MSRSTVVLFLIFAAAASAFSQARMVGKVVEVVDGRTVVIEADGRRLVAAMQYLEVPEPEQQLHKTVRDHLEKLTLGKEADFRPTGLSTDKAFGQLYIASADVAVQMLRDGAAWHIAPEKSGQRADDASSYSYNQEQAKMEKRGVWGVEGLKPPSVFRAERIERERQERTARELAAKNEAYEKAAAATAAKPAVQRNGPWSDVNPYLKNPGPLVHGYNAASKTGYVATSLMGVRELEKEASDRKTAVDISYIYKQEEKARKGTFVISVVSAASDWRFVKENGLTVIVDEKTVWSGKPKRTSAREEGKAVEKLTFEVSKATIEKIVYGGEVFVKIGDYMLYPSQGLQLLLYNMLQVAE
jgi:endonuclease YncB( thermonuclease family)